MSTLSLRSSFAGSQGAPLSLPQRLLRALRGPAAPEPLRCLQRHDSVFVRAAAGARVQCVRGCVWVTVDGLAQDIVLERGESFTLERRGRVGVYALEASQVRWA